MTMRVQLVVDTVAVRRDQSDVPLEADAVAVQGEDSLADLWRREHRS